MIKEPQILSKESILFHSEMDILHNLLKNSQHCSHRKFSCKVLNTQNIFLISFKRIDTTHWKSGMRLSFFSNQLASASLNRLEFWRVSVFVFGLNKICPKEAKPRPLVWQTKYFTWLTDGYSWLLRKKKLVWRTTRLHT